MLHSIHPLLVSLFCNLWSLCVVIVLLNSSRLVVTAIKDRLTVATSASVDGTLLPLISEAAMEEEGRSGAANLSLSVSWDCKNEKEAARKLVQRPPKKRLADICLVPVSGGNVTLVVNFHKPFWRLTSSVSLLVFAFVVLLFFHFFVSMFYFLHYSKSERKTVVLIFWNN